MENATLGKRISHHRKRLHLTQEQLAERVGVSPQAVSKWENDISCPDISILPELAAIFGVSVDELLGVEKKKTVYEAEVVDKQADHKSGAIFEINLDGKHHGIWFAIYILCIGCLFLVNSMYNCGVSWWSVVWMTALLIGGLSGITRSFSCFSLGLMLAGAYLLLSEFSVLRLNLGWGVAAPVILLLWGISLLIDAMRKKHPKKVICSDGRDQSTYNYQSNDGYITCEQSFGSQRVAVGESLLRGGRIESNFGNFTVDFSGCAALAEDCRISIEHNFGRLVLLVPDRFTAKVNKTDTTAGTINVKGQPAAQADGTLQFDAELSFGAMEIHYI